MSSFFWFAIAAVIGYALGFHDGRWGKPVPPLRGTYDSGEHDDRVDDYPDDWN